MKLPKLIIPTVLLCAIAQVNAGMMQYNTSNQVIKSDKQTMSYGPKGYLASVDDVHILHGGGGSFIEQKGVMTSTVFGGVRMLSNGVSQSIFADNHSTLKTASSDKVQHSYTDPYGNAVATPKIKGESYPLERNRMTYDGGYQINGDLINFNARSYMSSIKRFTSNDSYDVPNRYSFSSGNPVMKFDPSGHNAQKILNNILNYGVNSGGTIFGLFIMAGSGGSLAPLLFGMSGFLSGIFGLGAQASSEYAGDTKKYFKIASTGFGFLSLAGDLVGAITLPEAKVSGSILSEEKSIEEKSIHEPHILSIKDSLGNNGLFYYGGGNFNSRSSEESWFEASFDDDEMSSFVSIKESFNTDDYSEGLRVIREDMSGEEESGSFSDRSPDEIPIIRFFSDSKSGKLEDLLEKKASIKNLSPDLNKDRIFDIDFNKEFNKESLNAEITKRFFNSKGAKGLGERTEIKFSGGTFGKNNKISE